MNAERWREVDRLYHSALKREPDERAVFLTKACQGDEELRRELDELLAQDSSSDNILDRPAVDLLADSTVTQLTAGTQLGPYRIEAVLGGGGQGKVYRAVDTRLKRTVAIKVAKEKFAERFQREARAIAALNHPNICTLYDVGPNYLVMELVEGPTLAERIKGGAIPLEEALGIAKQIAEALEAAHEKGITHRDLKPGNVKVKPDGAVKVLDFGLAKLADPVAIGQGEPTLTLEPATRVGVILGTAAYMSPEQAQGKPVDRRADIWSFGVVLWEMLTGRRTFQGETVSGTLAAVLTKQPEWEQVPAKVQRLLRSCLQKDPKQRLQAIGDWRLLLEDPPRTEARPTKLPWIAAAVLAVIAVGASFIHLREAPPPERTLRYLISAPENSAVHSFAVSPDGRFVTIAAAVNGKRQLWLRALDALQAQPMPGTEDAMFPFWSPDSRYIGFFAQDKLKKIAASGGPAQSLCNATDGRGGSWSRDDEIVFSPGADAAIQRVPAAGGVPAEVTKTKGVSRSPVFLPDGRHFLYMVTGASPEKNGVYLSSLDGSENRRVLADESSVVFAAGRLLFIRENTLMAQPFDAKTGEVSGDVFLIAEGVSLATTSYAPITASENGVLLYRSGGAVGSNQIVWFDRAGKLLGSVGAPGDVLTPSISPNEKMVAFARGGDIWLRDLARGTDTRLTSDASGNFNPFWSPKGDRIVFTSNRGGRPGDLYQKAANGSGKDELLLSTANPKVLDQWFRDGRFIVYSELDPKTKGDLWVLPVGQGGAPSGPGDQKPIPFLQTEFNEFQGQLSPDAQWMAYISDESGQREVYVRSFPAAEGKWRISTAGGDQPRWRGDGKELFFAGADGEMMAVAIKAVTEPKPSFEPGAPVPLFESHIVEAGAFLQFQYDVTAGGRRFLVDTTTATAYAPPLTVVVNWTAGLKN